MAGIDSIKHQVIRQLTEENLADLGGRLPQRAAAARHGGRKVRLTTLAMLVAACLTVLAQAGPRATSRSDPPAEDGSRHFVRLEPTERLQSAAAMPSIGIPSATAVSEAEEQVFPAPVPLDPSVFPLPVHTVVLDPGHGGEGNVGTVAANGLAEKDLTLDIALRLRELLLKAGYRVLMTRRDDRAVTLDERTQFANQSGADIFVSIHVNWLGDAARGIETFFLGSTEDPYLTHLASRENRDSGYSLAGLRQILEGVYANLRQEESRRLAVEVQRELHSYLGEVAPGIVDRGVKTAPFVVLVGTEMPAILAEVSALSSDEEARLLELPAYREYIALAIFSGICAYARSTDEPEYQAS